MLAKEGFLVYIIPCDAGLAQLVARNLAKVEVAGSNPVARSMIIRAGSSIGLFDIRRSGQVVRQRPAKPLPPVRIRASPPKHPRVLSDPFCYARTRTWLPPTHRQTGHHQPSCTTICLSCEEYAKRLWLHHLGKPHHGTGTRGTLADRYPIHQKAHELDATSPLRIA